MEVCIINTVERFRNSKGWQIMKRSGSGYYHVFPGKMFTLDDAKKECAKNDFVIIAIGNFWKCFQG